MPNILFVLSIFLLTVLAPAEVAPFSRVEAAQTADSVTLSNAAIAATWSIRGNSLQWQTLTNRFTGKSLPLAGSVFELVPREGPVLRSSDFKMVSPPIIEDAAASRDSSKGADHLPGRQVRLELEDSFAKLRITWTAILREGANYIRQQVTVRTAQPSFALTQIVLIDAVIPAAVVSGHVKGSPVTAGTWFLGFEHPLSDCRVRADRVSCWLSRELPLQADRAHACEVLGRGFYLWSWLFLWRSSFFTGCPRGKEDSMAVVSGCSPR